MLSLVRILAPMALMFASTTALAHPFLDVQPFPIASVESSTNYELSLVIFPGDTPVQSVQLDFELSAVGAFGAPTGTLGSGFSLIWDPLADPLHFSVVGDFTGNPLAADGTFDIAELTLLAGPAGGTLSMLDSSVVIALEDGVPEEFELHHISNVQSNTIVIVVPEPSGWLLLAAGLTGLAALARGRRARS